MRPPLHAIAPSQSALSYFRQILFLRLYEYRPTLAVNCARIQYNRARGLPRKRGFHGGALGVGGKGRGVTPCPSPSVPPLEWGTMKNPTCRGKKGMHCASSVARPKPKCQVRQGIGPSWRFQRFRLIHTKRLNEAIEKWLDVKDRNADEKYVRRLGIALMKAFNRNHRARETPRIFHLMAATNTSLINTRCLNLCLEAYLLSNRPSKLIQAFKKYQGITKPNHMTINIILRNFIAMGQLADAEELLKILLESRGPITQTAFAILLGGVKQTTGDFEEMKRIFEWIKTTTVSPHSSIYNIMIKMALDCNRHELAKKYVEEMVTRGLKYNMNTFGIFLSTQSKAGDWEGVGKTMLRMQEYGIKLSTEGFNILLLSYARAADLPQTERFFKSMISYDIAPNLISFNIMVHASARAKDDEAKGHWIHRMKSAGFVPNAVTFNILFHELRKTKPQPSLLRRLYNAASDMDPNLVDAITKRMLLDSMFKHSLAYKRRKKLQRLNPLLLESDVFLPEIREMESAINSNRPHDAICIFNDIVSKGLKPTSFLTATVIRASFQLPESEHLEVSRLLYIAQSRGVPVNEVFMTVVSSNEQPLPIPSPGQLDATLKRIRTSYKFMGRSYLPISNYVLVQSAWQLIQSHNAHAAIFLMNKISSTCWGSSWNIVGLTVLLKAYTMIMDLKGMLWVVDTMEVQKEIPDKLFMKYLKRAKEGAQTQEGENFISWLILRCIKRRSALKGREMDTKAKEILKSFER